MSRDMSLVELDESRLLKCFARDSRCISTSLTKATNQWPESDEHFSLRSRSNLMSQLILEGMGDAE